MKTNNKAPKVETISIYQFLRRIPDENTARLYIEKMVWAAGRYCPYCHSINTVEVKDAKPMPYRCKDCRKHFSVRVGNIFESSKVSLQTWLGAIYLMTTAKKGVSSLQLSRQLGITQKTAWMLCHKIREMWTAPVKPVMSGEVEVDESYFGGIDRNRHASQRAKIGRGAVGKQPVIGLYDRNGKVAGTVVRDTDSGTLHSVINANVRKGTQIYTDSNPAYHKLEGYPQEEVCHSVGEYVRGKAHTNGIESFWSLLKRGYIGTFHHMSPKHLQKYVNEFASRQSMRRCDTIDAMAITTKAGVGKSLSWKELTYEPA